LSVNVTSLIVVSSITSATLIILATIYRPLIIECFDPVFMRSIGGKGTIYHIIFMALVVLNMVSAFQALGTLMALGMMMLPAIAARFWAREIWSLIGIAFLIAIVSAYIGLVLSYQFNLPSGPTIILVAGVLYMISLTIGPYGSLKYRVSK
jgi:zinc/manganese transport system permease protein